MVHVYMYMYICFGILDLVGVLLHIHVTYSCTHLYVHRSLYGKDFDYSIHSGPYFLWVPIFLVGVQRMGNSM